LFRQVSNLWHRTGQYGGRVTSGVNTPTSDRATKVLVLLTSDISSVLVRGQLAYLRHEGFHVDVGTAVSEQHSAAFDAGVPVHHLPFVREPSPLRDLKALAATIALIRRVRPDIVNVSTPKAALIGMIAAWMCRVPVRVYTVRGFRFETMTSRRRRFYIRLEKMIMSLAHQVLFNSNSLRDVAEATSLITAGRGVVLGSGSGNGIDASRFNVAVLPDRNSARSSIDVSINAGVTGFVGRLTANKGLDDLVHVFADMSHTDENLWLVVAGSEEEGDPITSTTRHLLQTHPRIRLLGWVSDSTTLYPAFDVLAFPSYREGFPNVPLEAQACGVPVVGYAATGTIDAVRDGVTGILVPVGARDELQRALTNVLTDVDLQARLGTAGVSWVRDNFDQRIIWASLADHYRHWLNQT
jgi:glycosyltransferase involved in cell wall biosynthesis